MWKTSIQNYQSKKIVTVKNTRYKDKIKKITKIPSPKCSDIYFRHNRTKEDDLPQRLQTRLRRDG